MLRSPIVERLEMKPIELPTWAQVPSPTRSSFRQKLAAADPHARFRDLLLRFHLLQSQR